MAKSNGLSQGSTRLKAFRARSAEDLEAEPTSDQEHDERHVVPKLIGAAVVALLIFVAVRVLAGKGS